VLIREAMLTFTGRVMVSPTAHEEELNEPMVVVILGLVGLTMMLPTAVLVPLVHVPPVKVTV